MKSTLWNTSKRVSLIRLFLRGSNATTDQTMPNHIPRCASLRTIFTRYLDFKAVPRRTFFQYLRYFNTDEQESEKLDEFLSVDTAVSISSSTHWSMLNSLAGRVIRLLPTRQAHNPRSAH